MIYILYIEPETNLLGTIVLGDSLGSLRDGVLGQLTGEDKADGSLDFLARDGGALVVSGQLAAFMSNTLEKIINKAVHDSHGLLANVDSGVAQVQNLEDVAAVGFVAATLASLISRGGLLNGALGGGLTGGFLFSLGSHNFKLYIGR